MGKICKRIAIFLLTTVLALTVLSGCSTNTGLKPAGKIKIGVTLYDQYDTFISQLMECFTELASENVEVTLYNAANSQQTQNDQVKKMIGDGCNVICVNLVDRTDPAAVIDAARKADVPIVFFNRELVEGDMSRWNKLFYVGANAIESGVMEGELAASACKENEEIDRNGDGVIQYVVLEGEAGHQDSIVRTEYSVDTLIKAGVEVDKLGYAIANWNRAQAQTKMAQLIEQNGDGIELVLSNNDDMALGAIDAYEAAGVSSEKRPVFFGIDGTDVGLEAVADGRLNGTVYNDKEGQAGAMYRLCVTLAKGGSITDLEDEYEIEDAKYIRLHYTKITDANIGDYLKLNDDRKDEAEAEENGDESADGSLSDYPMFKLLTLKYDKYYEGDLVDENYFGDDKDHRLLFYGDEQYLLMTDPYRNAYPVLSEYLDDRVLDRAAAENADKSGTWGDIDVEEEYETGIKEGYGFMGPWYNIQRESISLLNDRILSFVTYYEDYAGGAHGYNYKAGTTLDISTGEEIELKDMIDIPDEQLRAMIRDRIKIEAADEYEQYWNLDDSLASYFVDPDSVNPDEVTYINHYNWIMDPEGIHFYFNPYDLAAYAYGIVEATVPYDMLGDFPGRKYIEDYENLGHIGDSPLYPISSEWDTDSGAKGMYLYYVPGKEGEGLAKGLYLKKNGAKASFDESFMMEDEQSMKTLKVTTADGREFIYVTSESFGYYYDFFAFEVTGDEPKPCGRAVFCKTELEPADYDGEDVSEGTPVSGGISISEAAFVDAEHMYFGEISTIIGDLVLVGQYRVGDDGMPEFSGDYKYVTNCSDHITLKKDLTVDVVDEAGKVVTPDEVLTDGTHVVPWRTAGDKFIDCRLDDGRIVRISYNRDGDEPDIDGEYLMDIFDGESYIG